MLLARPGSCFLPSRQHYRAFRLIFSQMKLRPNTRTSGLCSALLRCLCASCSLLVKDPCDEVWLFRIIASFLPTFYSRSFYHRHTIILQLSEQSLLIRPASCCHLDFSIFAVVHVQTVNLDLSRFTGPQSITRPELSVAHTPFSLALGQFSIFGCLCLFPISEVNTQLQYCCKSCQIWRSTAQWDLAQ